MEESQSQSAVQSSSSSNLNSTSKDSEEKGTPTTSSVSKTSQRTPSPSPRLPPPSQRKSTSPHPTPRSRSRSRASSRSPARSVHSSSSTNHQTPKGVKSQAEGTHKLVEYVDEDGISHWHRQEHVNLHTECGRHGDEWLFGGWSLMGLVRGLLGRR